MQLRINKQEWENFITFYTIDNNNYSSKTLFKSNFQQARELEEKQAKYEELMEEEKRAKEEQERVQHEVNIMQHCSILHMGGAVA